MTSRFLLSDIKHEEDTVLASYPDPLSPLGKACANLDLPMRRYRQVPDWSGLKGDPWTAGVGHTGADVHEGMTVTDTQADVWLRQDVDAVKRELDAHARWWWTLDDNRQDVLVQMGFQMGVPKLLQFTRTLKAMQAGRYQDAADYMLDSAWAKQTPARANRMSCQMRSGLRAWARADAK